MHACKFLDKTLPLYISVTFSGEVSSSSMGKDTTFWRSFMIKDCPGNKSRMSASNALPLHCVPHGTPDTHKKAQRTCLHTSLHEHLQSLIHLPRYLSTLPPTLVLTQLTLSLAHWHAFTHAHTHARAPQHMHHRRDFSSREDSNMVLT